ncbi:MAG TPA: UvrD-helicase domain-containing protein [Alphaproteobacteria bacterium]|nr:UvrD-helicase domain-containing protein [Alphaproteobacteria bacterium]
MRFHADLHVHSKYSRATSRDCDLEHLAYWAARKGIGVVATGDFTHPAWRAELKEKLLPAEPGLFRLRQELERAVAEKLPPACRSAVRFMLSVEISTIYKKGERTRKIHHLLYAPDFDSAERISARLARIGNIASDGRPILGLDSRHLLEITLEASHQAFLVPAHIWTPWFAVLGSQSGFDSILECYGDLAHHIFALETGLSSDPAMNWRLSFLDRYRLVSNSDAHSPAKLGRETTLFDSELDYFAIRRALETGEGYVGTVEFFPEEGKYHLDGHRKCGARLSPKETREAGGRCPVCGERVTVGVLHRVEALADRSEDEVAPPPTAGEVASLVPLPEVLSELASTGPASLSVERSYDRLVASLGPELAILQAVPLDDIARADSSLLAEAIARLRAGRVIREAGYDGEYGVIRLFEAAELKRRTAGGLLFEVPGRKRKKGDATAQTEASGARSSVPAPRARLEQHREALAAPGGLVPAASLLAGLDDDQRLAAATTLGPLLVIAGPGSGKTRALTHRIAHLVADCGVPRSACLAITFTRRAAAEMRERLARLLPPGTDEIPIHTFHSLGLAILREHGQAAGLHRGFRLAGEAERTALLAETLALSERKARALLNTISKAKRSERPAEGEVAAALSAYQQALALKNAIDFDDLVGLAVRALASDAALAAHFRERFRFISVDEFQDVDAQQYRLLALLAQGDGNLAVIGDPRQAIYGFRGADASAFERFKKDYPAAAVVTLRRNYRSSGTIVAAATQLIAESREEVQFAEIVREMAERITTHSAATERAEAEFVVQSIEELIGGHSFFSIDSGRATTGGDTGLGFADFAVLYRTDAQSAALAEALARSGIPFKKASRAPLAGEPAVRALLRELAQAGVGAEAAGRLAVELKAAAARLALEEGAPDAAAIERALQQLVTLAEVSAGERRRFEDALLLATDADFWDPRADAVSLLTLHAAKGLEFAVVFIVGLEDGILPLRWGEAGEASLAEERRLAYVGMTRAKDRLFLCRARERLWRGRRRALPASPFLADIESELVKVQHMPAPARKPAQQQLKLL